MLLGGATAIPQARQGTQGGRPVGILVEVGQDQCQQFLVDPLPGEVAKANALAECCEVVGGIGQRDAGTGSAEIADHDHAMVGDAIAHAHQGGARVRHQLHRSAAGCQRGHFVYGGP
ncbi:Uncharacterised protein [Mycobacteroides abscessus]|nr:Uncharacterised protein [Mycobacteroides abscessus]